MSFSQWKPQQLSIEGQAFHIDQQVIFRYRKTSSWNNYKATQQFGSCNPFKFRSDEYYGKNSYKL